jgi:hypothetical protein
MKYIIVDERGIELPIIFSEMHRHADIAGPRKVISAGFCRFNARTCFGEDPNGSEDQTVASVSCWGESVGLRVKSRKEDAALILKHNEFRS